MTASRSRSRTRTWTRTQPPEMPADNGGMKHVVIDTRTGDIIKAEPIPADVDIEAYMRQQVHDCPECRAAWERGERPTIVGPAELAEARASYRSATAQERRDRLFARRPRWRDLKRAR